MSRRATIKDVARLAAVSTVTVSRVVNASERVQPATRDRVQQAMRSLGYSPNIAAQAMRTNISRSIGFLTPELTSPTNAAVAQATEQALAEAGYTMLVTSSDYRAEREILALGLLASRRVDGIILYVSDEADPALIRAIGEALVPLVLLDRSLPIEADIVMSDHATAMRAAVQELARLGHRRVALLHNALDIRPTRERRRAFAEATAAIGPCVGRIVAMPAMAPSDSSPLDQLLDGPDPVTACICDGVRLLRQLLQAVRRRGLVVPDDLSVIAVDALEASSLTSPETTVIVRDFAAIGRTAAELMLGRLASPERAPTRVLLPSELRRHGSCGPPPERRR